MPRVKQSQLARARGGNEMSQSVAARMTRNKMRADWDTVRKIDYIGNYNARSWA
jgi:hypothetical protein